VHSLEIANNSKRLTATVKRREWRNKMAKLKSTALGKFVEPSVASDQFGCSERHLKNLQDNWEYGKHYIDVRVPKSPRAAYRYNLEKLTEWFTLKPEMR
jgi:hypothetical protein